MITLLIIWGWLLLGVAIGRVVFVRTLGDQPRRAGVTRRDNFGHRYLDDSGWTEAFTRAVVVSVACVVAWPIALPVALMFAQTGTEKLQARRERLEAEVARLEQEVRDA